MAIAVASTVVLTRILVDHKHLHTPVGHIAIGWLVVEDIFTVFVLVLIPAIFGGEATGGGGIAMALLWTTLKIGALVAFTFVVGGWAIPRLLTGIARTGSRELFTLAVIVAAVTIAYGSSLLFGVSFALGAFFAGMVLRESQFSHRAAEETLPLRDAFAVLFFVAVGMLFDPAVLVEQPLRVLQVVAIIVVGKSVAASALVLAFGYPLSTALTVSAGLGQIGEFSFILAALGMSLGLLPAEGQSLIVAGALISIALNPLFFHLAEPLGRRLARSTRWARRRSHATDPLAELPMTTEARFLSKQVVLVGYGRVGREIAASLERARMPFVVIEENREAVEQLRGRGLAAVFGNATEAVVLVQAHVATARMLAIATPQTLEVRKIAEVARTLNPEIRIAVRSHNADEAALLEAEGTARVFVGETELANAMTAYILGAVAPPGPDATPSRRP
jgi:CPA2 family monovalent cation:H+ antiporter-2